MTTAHELRENEAASLFRMGFSYNEIAYTMKVTRGTVSGLIDRYRKRIKRAETSGDRGWTDEQNATLKAMHAEGKTAREVASELGKNYDTTRIQGRRLGLVWENNSPQPKAGGARKVVILDFHDRENLACANQRKADQKFVRELALAFQRGDHLPKGQIPVLRLIG